MRRFFVWSALTVLIGLLLAGGGYWAYWHFYARFQPVLVDRNQAEVQQILDSAAWLSSGGGGQPLYIIGYRDSPAMQRYEREEAPKLRAAGIEPRIIVFARPDREGLAQSTAAERATVAELWINRDWPLYQRWTATPSADWAAEGLSRADGDIARTGVIEASRQAVRDLTRLLGHSGLQARYPLILWRDRQGFLKACACSDERSWAFIRDDLDAPERVAPEGAAPEGPLLPDAPDADAPPTPGDGALPYPQLPPPATPNAPATPGTTPGASPGAARRPPAATTAPPPPTSPPQARKDEEAVFY